MSFKERLTTPVGRFAFLSIFEKKDWSDPDSEPKFEATLLFDKKTNLDDLKKFISAAAKEKFGDKLPAKLKLPIKNGDECMNDDGEIYEGYEGKMAIRSSSLYDLKQIVIKEDAVLKHATKDDIKSGDYGQLILGAGGHEHKGSKGVSLYLISVCKTKDGEALATGGGATSEEDLFGDVEEDDDLF